MATCPHCRGHLTEDHRCPRSPLRVAIETVLVALAGGIAALLILSFIDPNAQPAMDMVMLVGGALAGVALDRWLRH